MDNEVIHINSVVSSKDYRPFVQLKWGKEGCQMTPAEAREHAYSILECANAAETDAMMVLFLREKIGINEGVDIAAFLENFREFREKVQFKAPEGMNKTSL